ncbi:hypothetical protein GGH95_004097, partial [Coemansia sp. RSA 1836]
AENTDTVYGGLNNIRPDAAAGDNGWAARWHRVHKRIYLDPIGQPISNCTDAHEVVVAVADAMTAYINLYRRTRILQRNIDMRNIFYRVVGGRSYGTLVGYSDALNTRVQSMLVARAKMHMTLELRSILSLQQARAPGTLLDAFESLVYLVSYMGFCGVTQAERTASTRRRRVKDPFIRRWSEGTAARAISDKRDHMDSARSFAKFIADSMYHGPLRDLAIALHDAIFLSPGCSGAIVVVLQEGVESDPLVRRNNSEEAITEIVLRVLRSHRQQAANALAVVRGVAVDVAPDPAFDEARADYEQLQERARAAAEAERRAEI